MRVMTFNVRRDVEADGEHAWPHRRDLVVDTIRFHAPDVVGLQEPLSHQVDYVRAELDLDWRGVGRLDGDDSGEHVPIGYDPDVLSLAEWGTFWLSETPETPGTGWDAAHPRIVTWARFEGGAGGPFLFCNTHLDHEGERARRRGAQLLRDRVADLADADPVIVVGDMNATAGEDPLVILTASGDPNLADAGSVAEHGHHGPNTTRTDFERLRHGRKIDHVLVSSEVSVHQQGVCLDAEDGYPSDHLPLVAEVSVPDRGERSR
ncbi:MAG: endonuclease/exonuclease/phosphatase family protein [Haloarculaceae archaeon]